MKKVETANDSGEPPIEQLTRYEPWLRQILAHQLAQFARQYIGTQKRDIMREQSIDASLAHSSLRLFAIDCSIRPSHDVPPFVRW